MKPRSALGGEWDVEGGGDWLVEPSDEGRESYRMLGGDLGDFEAARFTKGLGSISLYRERSEDCDMVMVKS